jgi:dienelactone hydrolase
MSLRSPNSGGVLIGLLCAAMAVALAVVLMRPLVLIGYVLDKRPTPRGTHAVFDHELRVPLRRGDGAGTVDVAVHFWTPARVEGSTQVYPLIVYAPGWGGTRNDNTALVATLASHGFVVAALDDVVHDPVELDARTEDRAVRHTDMQLGDEAGRARTVGMFDPRLALEARKASRLLDALLETGTRDLVGIAIDPMRIGMLGASFGGAASVEAALADKRFRAVINLDGWLRGRALKTVLDIPFANFNSTRGAPDPTVLMAANANAVHRFLAARNSETNDFIKRQMAARSDALDITIVGASHGDYSDELYDPQRWRQWRPWRPWRRQMIAPGRMHEIMDAYVAAFFGKHLSAREVSWLTQTSSRFSEVSIRLGRGRGPE